MVCQVFRASTPLVVSLCDYLFLGRTLPEMRSWLALIGLLAGATGYVYTDSGVEVGAGGLQLSKSPGPSHQLSWGGTRPVARPLGAALASCLLSLHPLSPRSVAARPRHLPGANGRRQAGRGCRVRG